MAGNEQQAALPPFGSVSDDVVDNAFQHKAALSRDEAVEVALDASENDPAPDWNERDLSALLGHLHHQGCSKENVDNFVNLFEGTTTEDIMRLIGVLRGLDNQASRYLFCPKNRVFRHESPPAENPPDQQTASSSAESAPPPKRPKTSHVNPELWADWGKAAVQVARTRKIADETQRALALVLTEGAGEESTSDTPTISTSRFSKCYDFKAAPNYSKIYEILANLVSARSVQKLGALESSILLNIFDELEKDIDEHYGGEVEVFRRIFQDFKKFDVSEFRLHSPVTNENAAEVVMNLFNLPQEYFDFANTSGIKKE